MATPAQITQSYSKNISFKSGLEIALQYVAQQVLSNTTSGWFINITVGNIGYNGYIKRIALAQKLALEPCLYTEAFARQILIIDSSRVQEQDINTLTSYCTEQLTTSPNKGTAYTIFDVVAGVTINDLDL